MNDAADRGARYARQRAAWLAALPVDGRLPERTVVVRNEPVAHAWRRDLVAAGRADLLAGTRFVTAFGTAIAMAPPGVALGEETARPARIAALLVDDLAFEAFELDVLRRRPGWDEALAKTIGELEAAGLTAAELAACTDPRVRDVAEIWRRIDASAVDSWTSARIYREVAAILEADPRAWPHAGPVLVEITGHETAVYARWLRAIPGVHFVAIPLRPQRTAHEARIRAWFPGLQIAPPIESPGVERDLLAAYLFATPDVLSAADRPRSRGDDGTLALEQHAGLDDELDAAVSWIVDEIGRGTALERIAVVVPQLDPYAALLASRLTTLGADAVHVVGGLPALSTASGVRIVTALRALSGYLALDAMADVLPILKITGDSQLSRRDAVSLLYELGTTGGSRANPAAARDWAARRANRLDAARVELESGSTAEHRQRSLVRMRDQLAALATPLAALDAAVVALVENAPISVQWGRVRVLCADHLRLGTDGARILAAADEALARLCAADLLAGLPALDAITRTIEAIRLPTGRFGEPRLTIVSLRDAVGLSFDAVRVLGLVEGSVPATPREDPVLPDAARAAIDREVPTSWQRGLAQLHALHFTISATAERLVLSSARMDGGGRYREPSGVFTEAAAAVGRGDSAIPDARALRRRYFEPAHAQLATARTRWPIDERGRLLRAATARAIPGAWRTAIVPLARWRPPAEPHAMDGYFPDGPFPDLPGLAADYPLSASALGRLLECPHRFLYERVLGWHPPPQLVEDGTVDALSYGSLFHETAEAFYRAHGAAFCAHEGTLAEWKRLGAEIADAKFAAFVDRYPLVGLELRNAQRRRLQNDLSSLLDADWQVAKTFFAVEQPFGPLALPVEEDVVRVRGFIDRIDTIGETTLVRDLKTGRAKPREKKPWMPAYDVQLGLYGLVVRTDPALPATVRGAYVYPSDSSGDARDFDDDFGELERSTAHWVATGLRMLRAHHFPRTPDADDCQFCSFRPVCGPQAEERAESLLRATPDLADFATIKLGSDDDD